METLIIDGAIEFDAGFTMNRARIGIELQDPGRPGRFDGGFDALAAEGAGGRISPNQLAGEIIVHFQTLGLHDSCGVDLKVDIPRTRILGEMVDGIGIALVGLAENTGHCSPLIGRERREINGGVGRWHPPINGRVC